MHNNSGNLLLAMNTDNFDYTREGDRVRAGDTAEMDIWEELDAFLVDQPEFSEMVNMGQAVLPELNNHMYSSSLDQEIQHFQTIEEKVKANKEESIEEEDAVVDHEDDGEAEMSQADTFANYKPSKSDVGLKHPDLVVETSSLASVEPPDVDYTLAFPPSVIADGKLSALQLEVVIYACQQHSRFLASDERAGFLIGDGVGVGKGRSAAGIIYENYLRGRKKALWFSVSSDLKYDAERDLRDIGAPDISVCLLSKVKYGNLNGESSGILDGVVFSTYSSLIRESRGNNESRINELVQWCGGEFFEGPIILDECHKAKNLSTKTSAKVIELQKRLPKARIVYCSATGASELKNMAYMTRLGLWGKSTPFQNFQDFLNTVEKWGVRGMELVPMEMKLRGMYMARQLSFQGVSFKIHEVALSQKFTEVYNQSVHWWIKARKYFQEALDLRVFDPGQKSRPPWAQFWADHQRFFRSMCIASKVASVIEQTSKAIQNDKCVVIGLQSTGEARTIDAVKSAGNQLTSFVSSAKGILRTLIERHFPCSDHKILPDLEFSDTGSNLSPANFSQDEESGERSRKRKAFVDELRENDNKLMKCTYSPEIITLSSDSEDEFPKPSRKNEFPKLFQNCEVGARLTRSSSPSIKQDNKDIQKMRQELLDDLEKIELPCNTLDTLIDELGGPASVAEMTGRKHRIVRDNSKFLYKPRSENIDKVNIFEKDCFMKGEKFVAVISEAASSGISLQADKRVPNRRRRVHMMLELPWSADRAIQQFGRTHRSNQVSSPEYVFLISGFAGEKRFASIVAKRLENLGALTHGDRRATNSTDLTSFNINNKYGRQALDNVLKQIVGQEEGLVPFPNEQFLESVKEGLAGVGMISTMASYRRPTYTIEKGCNEVSVFLNRILGLEVKLQNQLFKHFMDTLDEILNNVKKDGKWDMGILDLGFKSGKVKKIEAESFKCQSSTGTVTVELHKIVSDRGISYDQALDFFIQGDCSFYKSNKRYNEKCLAILVKNAAETGMVQQFRPNIGRTNKVQSLDDIKLRYTKVSPKHAKSDWIAQYQHSEMHCNHSYGTGNCKLTTSTTRCKSGLRKTNYHVLTGSVLSVWSRVEQVLRRHPGSQSKMQIIRVRLEDDSKLIGCLMPEVCVEELKSMLADEQKASLPLDPIIISDNESVSSDKELNTPNQYPYIPRMNEIIPRVDMIPTDSLTDLLAQPSTSQVLSNPNSLYFSSSRSKEQTDSKNKQTEPEHDSSNKSALNFLQKFDFGEAHKQVNLQSSSEQSLFQMPNKQVNLQSSSEQSLFQMPNSHKQVNLQSSSEQSLFQMPNSHKQVNLQSSSEQSLFQIPNSHKQVNLQSSSEQSRFQMPNLLTQSFQEPNSNGFSPVPLQESIDLNLSSHTKMINKNSSYMSYTNNFGYQMPNELNKSLQQTTAQQYIPFSNNPGNLWPNEESIPHLETEPISPPSQPISPPSESNDNQLYFTGILDQITRS
ncbi:protein strawberry notch homolog 1-like [Antedon mediterranea]|uniref:protein strawberry notch homolog 1-like n=1 Tax=Antedon mediterranea TaxID=105859 RepID=UPI003AF908BE